MDEKLIVQTANVLNEADHKLLARMLTTLGEASFVVLPYRQVWGLYRLIRLNN